MDRRVGWRTPAGVQAGAIFGGVFQLGTAPPPGVDLVKLTIDSGLATAVVSTLQVRASTTLRALAVD